MTLSIASRPRISGTLSIRGIRPAINLTAQDSACSPDHLAEERKLRRINAVNARLARAKRGSWGQAYLRRLLAQMRRAA
jgi:hypothetical protein